MTRGEASAPVSGSLAAQVVVVPMRDRHLGGVAAIESYSNPRPWSRDLFASELKQAASRCFVAVLPTTEVVGFACLMSTGFETHVTNIAVSESARRSGVASMLLLRLINETIEWGLDSVTLEVRASNTAARSLYEAFGFVEDGVRAKYYENTEDAIIMWAHDVASDPVAGRIRQISAQMAGR